MKKLTLLLGAMFIGATSLLAQTLIDGIYYELNDDTRTASVAESLMMDYAGDIIIPTSVKYDDMTYTVTEIDQYAFAYCKIKSITLPNSITKIGYYAFSNSSLTSISIPESMTTIGALAFSHCDKLTSVTIPNTIKTIRSSAFEYCENLTSITIPNSVIEIGSTAFMGCYSLVSATLPDSLTEISDQLFASCRNLTSINIPNTVTIIGKSAFQNCGGLSSITIPNSVTNIKTSAFCECDGLTSIVVPNSVTEIGSQAFGACRNLTTITLPDSLTRISNNLFCNDTSLTTVIIPNSVTTICSDAFKNCHNITSITIPENVTFIEAYAFKDCSSLTEITCLSPTPPRFFSTAAGDSFENCDIEVINVPIQNKEIWSSSYIFDEKRNTNIFNEWSKLPQKYVCNVLLSVNNDLYGTTEGDGIYEEGSTISIIAIPASDCVFKQWEDGNTDNPRSIVITEDCAYKAFFEKNQTEIFSIAGGTIISKYNGQILVNGEAPAFVVTVAGQKIANANLKAGVYFVVADGKTVGVSVR